jgi:hypothetical protein
MPTTKGRKATETSAQQITTITGPLCKKLLTRQLAKTKKRQNPNPPRQRRSKQGDLPSGHSARRGASPNGHDQENPPRLKHSTSTTQQQLTNNQSPKHLATKDPPQPGQKPEAQLEAAQQERPKNRSPQQPRDTCKQTAGRKPTKKPPKERTQPPAQTTTKGAQRVYRQSTRVKQGQRPNLPMHPMQLKQTHAPHAASPCTP